MTEEEQIAKARAERLQEMKKKLYLGQMSQPSMSQKGLLNWPEGSWLDRVDKGLSTHIFRLEFGMPAEICLSCTALWFGVLIYVFCIIPASLIAASPGTSWRFALTVCGPWIGLMAGFWPRRCISSSMGGHSVAKKLLEFKPGMCLFGPYMCLAAAWYANASGMDAVALFFCSYYVTSTLVVILHGLVWRRRPLASAFAKEVKRYDRSLQDAAIALHCGTLINQSFPSAYTASAAVWSATLVATAHPLFSVPVAALVLLSSAIGNVYFRMHHLLDVFAGEAIGLAVTVMLSASGRANWILVVVLQVAQVVALELVHKYVWPQAPDNSRRLTINALQLAKAKLS